MRRIVSQFVALETETVSLLDALGRVLAEDVVSTEDVPAFDNSAMDGYAVRFADTQAASEAHPISLRVVGDLAAGAVPTAPLGPEEAVRIMTGAPVPPGSDAVVPFEDTDRTDWAKFGTRPGTSGDPATVGILLPPEFQDNVRFRAEDIKVGEQVLAQGKRIRPAEIGVLASMGRVQVAVYRRPVVAVIPTGDEVIEIDRPLQPGQVRNSAAHALEALVTTYGGVPRRLPVVGDTVEETRAALLSCLDCDLIVTIGGVSMGDYDLVRNVLGAEGEIDFWRIRMRPGKPLAFGHIEATASAEAPKADAIPAVTPKVASGSVIPRRSVRLRHSRESGNPSLHPMKRAAACRWWACRAIRSPPTSPSRNSSARRCSSCRGTPTCTRPRSTPAFSTVLRTTAGASSCV